MEILAGFQTLFIGLLVFYTAHIGLATYKARTFFIDKLGFMKFRIAHSVLSLFGIYLIVVGFGGRPYFNIYYPDYEDFKLTGLLMTMAFVFLAAIPSKEFKSITRNPMLWGIIIFGLAHLNANGDLGAIILFGSFVLYSPIAMYLSDKRKLREGEKGFEVFYKKTSLIPFLALIRGEAKWPKGIIWLLKPIVIGFVIAWIVVNNHEYLTGVELVFTQSGP